MARALSRVGIGTAISAQASTGHVFRTVDLIPINNEKVKNERPKPSMETVLLDLQEDHLSSQIDMTRAYQSSCPSRGQAHA